MFFIWQSKTQTNLLSYDKNSIWSSLRSRNQRIFGENKCPKPEIIKSFRVNRPIVWALNCLCHETAGFQIYSLCRIYIVTYFALVKYSLKLVPFMNQRVVVALLISIFSSLSEASSGHFFDIKSYNLVLTICFWAHILLKTLVQLGPTANQLWPCAE